MAKVPLIFKRTESPDRWVLNSYVKIQLCYLSKATASKINHTWTWKDHWWAKYIKKTVRSELEWPLTLHLGFNICCQILRYPMSYRSALGSQTRCRMMLLMYFSLFLLPTVSPATSLCQWHSSQEGRVAPGSVSSYLHSLARAGSSAGAAMEVQYLCVGGAGTNALWDHVLLIYYCVETCL